MNSGLPDSIQQDIQSKHKSLQGAMKTHTAHNAGKSMSLRPVGATTGTQSGATPQREMALPLPKMCQYTSTMLSSNSNNPPTSTGHIHSMLKKTGAASVATQLG